MKKYLPAFVMGIVFVIVAALLAIYWPEEKLEFELSEPAKFADVYYQNLTIVNNGWNPAEDVSIYIKTPPNTSFKVHSNIDFDISKKRGTIGGFSIIRRDEILQLAFLIDGIPFNTSDVTIKSGRAVAKPISRYSWIYEVFKYLIGAILGSIATFIFLWWLISSKAFTKLFLETFLEPLFEIFMSALQKGLLKKIDEIGEMDKDVRYNKLRSIISGVGTDNMRVIKQAVDKAYDMSVEDSKAESTLKGGIS